LYGGLGYGGYGLGGYGLGGYGLGGYGGYGAYGPGGLAYGAFYPRASAGIVIGGLWPDPFYTTYGTNGDSSSRMYPSNDIFGSNGTSAETGPAPKSSTATVRIKLPAASAELWFNGTKTQTSGVNREFVTPELEPGQSYSYEVRARWTANGRTMDQSRKLTVQAGGQVQLNFAGDQREQLPVPAVITGSGK
jgi:uncharacterized protein (TIGR03000 family)